MRWFIPPWQSHDKQLAKHPGLICYPDQSLRTNLANTPTLHAFTRVGLYLYHCTVQRHAVSLQFFSAEMEKMNPSSITRSWAASTTRLVFTCTFEFSQTLFLVCIKLAPWPEARWLVNRCRVWGKVQLNPAISTELFRETKNSSRRRGLEIGASKWLKRHIQKELFWNVNNRDISGLAIARFKCNIFPGKLTEWMNRCKMEQSC